jgi:hypothetical protein
VTLSVRHFPHDFVESMFHVDSAFWRTFVALLTKPGYLTQRYLLGKRQSYAPPLRSYLVISILYFVVASLVSGPDARPMAPTGQELQVADCPQIAERAGWMHRFWPHLGQSCMPALGNDRHALNAALQNMQPKVMFFVLPLVALVQLWMYRRQRPLYVENLIFLLHFQSFYFLTGTLLLLVAAVAPVFAGTGARVKECLDLALYAWSVAYLVIATRRVYRPGTLEVVLGLLALAIAYTLAWTLGVSAAGMYALLHA